MCLLVAPQEEEDSAGFDTLAELASLGHLDARRVPVDPRWLSLEMAGILFLHLLDLPRPTLVLAG